MNEGCDMMMELLREAGFTHVTKAPTDGEPGVFATLDAGAPRTIGLYYMYDVKQVDPSEWSSPPWDAELVDKPGVGQGDRRTRCGEHQRPAGRVVGCAASHFAVRAANSR